MTTMLFHDFITNALSRIVIARGRELPELHANKLAEIFSVIGMVKTKIVADRIEGLSSIPQNIIGEVNKIIADIRAEEQEREAWKAARRDNLGTDPEHEQIGIFNTELMTWHRSGLVQKNPEGITVPMSVEEYIKAGRPKTWSPIIDHWMQGYEVAYKLDLQTEGALLDYLMRYNRTLQDRRKQLLQERQEETRKKFLEKSAA